MSAKGTSGLRPPDALDAMDALDALDAGPPAAVAAPATSRAPLMRKVEFAWALPGGGVGEGSRLVPALPAFEEAFAAFARGTLFATPRGLVGVEDLWPGMEVRVAGGAMRRLLWRGSTTVVPGGSARVDPAMTRLTRISADALGVSRPTENLVLGPHARVVRRGPAVRALAGAEAALVPASDLADGDGVTALSPASPVPVFHLGFERHERLDAHGVEVESQHPGPHPGPLAAAGLSAELLDVWLSCFPHRRALADWGPAALPRLSGQDLALFDAA